MNRKTRAVQVIAVLLVLLASFQVANGASFSGKVVSVTDGDTIQVMHDGKAEKIRLNGIDCPESHQAFGNRAKQFASDLVFGKTVTVEVRDRDKYGRTVGDVILPDGQSLNRELVRAGFAWWYRQYSHDQSLGDLESEARTEKRGLWADPNPIPPWDFRRGKRLAPRPSSELSGDSLSERLSPASHGVAKPEEPSGLSDRLFAPAPQTGSDDSTLSERLGTEKASGPAATSEEDPKNVTVYTTRTGKKYHQEGCRYLSKSSIPIALTGAKARGYGPCSVCRPPP